MLCLYPMIAALVNIEYVTEEHTVLLRDLMGCVMIDLRYLLFKSQSYPGQDERAVMWLFY